MNMAAFSGSGAGPDLKQRLGRALVDVGGTLASVKSGALVQVWMPEHTHDGTIVLSCQGLPFTVAGVGDLLALFRCVSVRYRFSTDVMKPSLMGAIGRVYSTLEPEMSHNVQKYDKLVYLRVSEAQRCRVHSTLIMPIFGSDARDAPLAVFELVQGDRDVTFAAVLSQLAAALQGVHLYTTDLETAAIAAGLRKWPMHIDMGAGPEYSAGATGRLSPTGDEARGQGGRQDGGADKEPAASSSGGAMATEEKASPATSRGDEAGSWAPQRMALSRLPHSGPLGAAAPPTKRSGSLPLSSSPPLAGGVPPLAAAAATAAVQQPQQKAEGGAGLQDGSAVAKAEGPNTGSSRAGPGLSASDAQQFMSWLAQHGNANSGALDQLRALMNQSQQHQATAQDQSGVGPSGSPNQAPTLAGTQQQQPMEVSQQPAAPAPAGHSGSVPVNIVAPGGTHNAGAGPMAEGDKPSSLKLMRSGSAPRGLGAAAEAAEEGEGEDISSGGEEDDSDDDRGASRNNNRVGGGAGKRLRFEDLQAQFGLGLKEAANNLGICATTLKRACRRHGIKRWPRRQIAKLSKALNQMGGYNGALPAGLVQTASTSSAAPPAKPKQPKKPADPLAMQQATQLLFQQQLAAAAASGNGLPFGALAAAPGAVMMGPNGPVMYMQQGMAQAQYGGQAGAMYGAPQYVGPMTALLGQAHNGVGGGSAAGGGPGGAAGLMMGAMGGSMGAQASMHVAQGMGGMQMGMQMHGGGGGVQMQGGPHMLHPVLGGGSFSIQQALQQQQQQQHPQHAQLQLQQAQHSLALQQQQQQLALQQQLQQQQQQQHQQQQQQQHHHQHQHHVAGGVVHKFNPPDNDHSWMHSGPGLSGAGPSGVHGAPSAALTAAADAAARRASAVGEVQSPFSGVAMSPGLSNGAHETPDLHHILSGLPLPEDFIADVNACTNGTHCNGSAAGIADMSKSGIGSSVELMDLLGDDLAAR